MFREDVKLLSHKVGKTTESFICWYLEQFRSYDENPGGGSNIYPPVVRRLIGY